MSYGLKQPRRFARVYKKLHDNVAADVDAATEVVAADPTTGERKKGDLADGGRLAEGPDSERAGDAAGSGRDQFDVGVRGLIGDGP